MIEFIQIPQNAADLRQAQRLFHGRGHAYPGYQHITIDWFPPVILISLYDQAPMINVEELAMELTKKIPQCLSIQVQHRYQKIGSIDVIFGEPISELIVQENLLKFHLNIGKNRNIGLFLDMKNGRDWVKNNSLNKRVLNLFAYTCAFSVAAIAGQASSVLNVDMSRAALNRGRENHRLNKQNIDAVQFEKLDILKSFSRFEKRGPFDLLICDPPTFQKGSFDVEKDYRKILARLNRFMAPQSCLLLCLNAPELGKDFLLETMQTVAPEFSHQLDISAPPVFIDAQGKGLTTMVFQRDN